MLNLLIQNPKKTKSSILFIAFLFAFFQSVLMEVLGTVEPVFYMYLLVDITLLLLWVQIDNLDYDYKRTPLFNIGLLGLSIVFFPSYIYKTRQNVSETIKMTACYLLVVIAGALLNRIGLFIFTFIQNLRFST